MAVNISHDSVTVWKFTETGVVALCYEVVDFLDNVGNGDMYPDLDVSKAYLHQDENIVAVVFPRLIT